MSCPCRTVGEYVRRVRDVLDGERMRRLSSCIFVAYGSFFLWFQALLVAFVWRGGRALQLASFYSRGRSRQRNTCGGK